MAKDKPRPEISEGEKVLLEKLIDKLDSQIQELGVRQYDMMKETARLSRQVVQIRTVAAIVATIAALMGVGTGFGLTAFKQVSDRYEQLIQSEYMSNKLDSIIVARPDLFLVSDSTYTMAIQEWTSPDSIEVKILKK